MGSRLSPQGDRVPDRHDIIVIGGGPGGAAAALLLARAGRSVALIERKVFPRRKVCGEYLSATNRPLLETLGIGQAFVENAGPEVTDVGLFAGELTLQAPLPRPDSHGWGRALGRETLDALLVAQAQRHGATILQPFTAREILSDGAEYRVRLSPDGELRAPVVVAAHGFWEPGSLITQPRASRPRSGDLLGFKAHFRDTRLPSGLMPLLAFPGGYGGLVQTDAGRVSLSCCIRRDRLASLRSSVLEAGEVGDMGEVVFQHILRSCRGVRESLGEARRDGPWLGAGPLRPGIRVRAEGGLFRVGNAAGEAHPVVAEGISMAMQSAWLLTRRLLEESPRTRDEYHALGRRYVADWRRAFAPRLRSAAFFAHWAMRPAIVAVSRPVLRQFPGILSWGARLSGKATTVVKSSQAAITPSSRST